MAKDKYTYDVSIRPAAYALTPQGSVQIAKINTLQSYTVRLTLGGVPQAPQNFPAGDEVKYLSVPTLSPGDTITMEQPTGTTQESFTVPNVTLAGAVGSPNLSGTSPDSGLSIVLYAASCGQDSNETYPVQPQGGAFSVAYPKPLNPGDLLSITHFPGLGDKVRYESRLPGETPCLDAEAYQYPTRPGETPDPTPFSLSAGHLRPSAATGARIVLRRGGAIAYDYTDPAATSYIGQSIGVQPLPGDTIELYRPHTAPAPTTSIAIPAVRATYDTSNSLAAIDAPAAGRLTFRVSTQFTMWSNSRGALNTPAGRSVFDFNLSDGVDPAISLAAREIYQADWGSVDGRLQYNFGASPGDLAPPVLRLKLSSKYKLAKIRSSLTASVTSSEAASTTIKLTLPAKLKTSASSKPRTLASRKVTVGPGTTKVKLKMTKSAKKLIAKLRKGKYPAQKATLTVTAIDPSGNSSTTVKTTKLVRK